MSTDWALKIIALLHDPPGKPLRIPGHEEPARDLIARALGRAAFDTGDPLWRLVARRADPIASAFDRANFPEGERLRHDFAQAPVLTHILGGQTQKFDKLTVNMDDVNDATLKAVADLRVEAERASSATNHQEPVDKLCFLLLWRQLLPILRKQNVGSLGRLWYMLPAETRLPDHSIWAHQGATAAVASALPRPAFLVFSLGPVQSFIEQARRTLDLWTGSYLLSFLAWKSIEPIADAFGPDVVLYPSLWGQALADRWLRKRLLLDGDNGVPAPKEANLLRATLPNKFVALLPHEAAAEAAQSAVVSFNTAWEQAAIAVRSHLESLLGYQPAWGKLWEEQIPKQWEVYWSVYPWPEPPQTGDLARWLDAACDEYRRLLAPSESWEKFAERVKVFRQPSHKQPGQQERWGTNIGTAYGPLHQLAARGHEARKGLRGFALQDELGEKCTLDGQRRALYEPLDSTPPSREVVRDFWCKVEKALRLKRRYAELRGEGRERLSAVSVTKRFAFRAHLEGLLDVKHPKDETPVLRFPSTSSVTTAPFKARVLEHLAQPDDALALALAKYLKGLEGLGSRGLPPTAGPDVLPRLGSLLVKVQPAYVQNAEKFLRYDGDVLFPDLLTPKRLADDYNLPDVTQAQADAAASACRDFLRVARETELGAPAHYFAVLAFDGDRMGKWVAGALGPKLSEVIVDHIAQVLADTETWDWGWVLDQQRPFSAAAHTAMSRALADFAMLLVPWVVETHFTGRVVYAGGDDVLALLPAEEALSAARFMRALYSGHGRRDNGELKVDWQARTGYFEWRERLLTTMGPCATASAGIAIAHHQAPLDSVLAAAREAEKAAKRDYDRNAVCVIALKRSGEPVQVGAQWSYPTLTDDTVKIFEDLRDSFCADRLSSKLAYEVYDEAHALVAGSAAHQAALLRLLKRHKGGQVSRKEAEAQAQVWAPKLAALANALNIHREAWEQAWPKCDDRAPDYLDEDAAPQPGAMELAKWLLLVKFLERGGEE